MASDASIAQYIADQFAAAGEIRCRKMFGEYGLYLNEKFFAMVCDDQLFVKETLEGKTHFPSCHWHRRIKAQSPVCW